MSFRPRLGYHPGGPPATTSSRSTVALEQERQVTVHISALFEAARAIPMLLEEYLARETPGERAGN